jgi:hypothetical protein
MKQPRTYPYWTTTSGVSGFFAVMIWLNDQEPGLGPFEEPYDTGYGRYATVEEAAQEATANAQAMELPYYAAADLLKNS